MLSDFKLRYYAGIMLLLYEKLTIDENRLEIIINQIENIFMKALKLNFKLISFSQFYGKLYLGKL